MLLRMLAFIILLVCFLVFLRTYWIWALNQARRRGLLPEKGKLTMFDVRRLTIKGEEELAIRVYCQIFKTSYKEGKKAVEELKRSIQEKNSELE